jgi:hypothetical protein
MYSIHPENNGPVRVIYGKQVNHGRLAGGVDYRLEAYALLRVVWVQLIV